MKKIIILGLALLAFITTAYAITTHTAIMRSQNAPDVSPHRPIPPRIHCEEVCPPSSPNADPELCDRYCR